MTPVLKSFLRKKYDNFRRYRLFQKTGKLITADGSDDERQPEGLPNYNISPPSVLDPAPAPQISLPSADSQNDTNVADDFDGEEEEKVNGISSICCKKNSFNKYSRRET